MNIFISKSQNPAQINTGISAITCEELVYKFDFTSRFHLKGPSKLISLLDRLLICLRQTVLIYFNNFIIKPSKDLMEFSSCNIFST